MATDPLHSFLNNQAFIQNEVLQMQTRQMWEEGLRQPRYQEPKRLLKYGYKVYSQNEEDGIIAEIIKRIGDIPKTFIEIGIESGIECNTLRLLFDGWSGLWIEGDPKFVAQIRQNHAQSMLSGALKVAQGFVTVDNVNDAFTQGGMTGDIGLLSIDIDSNDIWLWEKVDIVNPAIVVIEYNSTWAPPLSIAQPNDPNICWRGTNYFGASLAAITKIGAKKGYSLVGCNYSGSNAFFVRSDLCGDKFLTPATAEEHYEPARYWLRHLKAGHRAGVGPIVQV